MKKILLTLAAVLCCAMIPTFFTSCNSKEDEPEPPTLAQQVEGQWFADVSGQTDVLWNYGKTYQSTEFKTDRTGVTRIYYTIESVVVGVEEYEFYYNAADDGTLALDVVIRGEQQKASLNGEELRITEADGKVKSLARTGEDMQEQFRVWDTQESVSVPAPTAFTVFVYGNAGGTMDLAIEEGFWEPAMKMVKDHSNVRLVCMYKYGMDELDVNGRHTFTGKYADPGDIVWFELCEDTKLNKLREAGLQIRGLGEQAKQLKICDPATLRMFFEFSSLVCPAKEYVFAIWGHGSGFDPTQDGPGKYQLADTRGVIADEWNEMEALDMYELSAAVKATGLSRLNTLFLHNCLMGNLETLTQVADIADYIVTSEHVLSSDGELLTEYVRGLMETEDSEKAVGLMFERAMDVWKSGYYEYGVNGDFKMLRTSAFPDILNACKHLADHLIATYATQKEAIDAASQSVYRVEAVVGPGLEWVAPFFDIADYAHKLWNETGDSEFAAISTEMDKAFEKAIVHSRDISGSFDNLYHYTLSFCLVHQFYYLFEQYKAMFGLPFNFAEGYEQSAFHQKTGWGDWLRINQCSPTQNPVNGGGGAIYN